MTKTIEVATEVSSTAEVTNKAGVADESASGVSVVPAAVGAPTTDKLKVPIGLRGSRVLKAEGAEGERACTVLSGNERVSEVRSQAEGAGSNVIVGGGVLR
jgi:hypothetical protein